MVPDAFARVPADALTVVTTTWALSQFPLERRRRSSVTGSLAMDDLIAGTDVGYRALTNPSFMDNLRRQAQAIKPGQVRLADLR